MYAGDISVDTEPFLPVWLGYLARHLGKVAEGAHATFILALPNSSEILRHEVDIFLDSLIEGRQGDSGLIVVLSEWPDFWAGLPDQPSCVRTGADARHHSAVQLFEFLLAMHVPHCDNAFGAEDAAELLGDDQQPSELLDALWLGATQTLVLPDPEAPAKMAACAGVALMLGQDAGLRHSRQITYAVQRLVPKEAALYMHAGGGLMAGHHVSIHWTPVTLLLASRLRTTP